ncbi:hypothetical protein CTM70_04995 [Photobacterium phosphoreum]|nr:hypothetical protein CTM70_04995 [Photobacterium phosphoreum]
MLCGYIAYPKGGSVFFEDCMINKEKLSDDDLIGLIKMLWQGKKWIIASAIISVSYTQLTLPTIRLV